MKYEIKDSIFDVDLNEQKILLDMESGKYFELNSTSSAIFSLVKESPKTIEQVVRSIAKIFENVGLETEAEIADHIKNTFYFIKTD